MSRTQGPWAQTLGYTQGWLLPTPPTAIRTPARPPRGWGAVLSILFHLLHEDHGPLIMLIFLNEYAETRPVGAGGSS